MKLSRLLWAWSRKTRDLEAISSGDPNNIARRSKNKVLGRGLGRAGVWRRLWE